MKKVLILIAFFITLGSCGTTNLATYNSEIEIYVDDQFIGKGQAKIKRTGTPKKIQIDTKHNGEHIGSIDLRREVKLSTAVVGFFTYGIGFFLLWKYPETVIIPVNVIDDKDFINHKKSSWDLPPGEWKRESSF